MRIIPAIDIINGKCVRLTKGDYATEIVYYDDPLEVAKKFEAHGLQYLHLVDLDGAKSKQIINYKVLERIARNTTLKIDFGGGINSNEDVNRAFDSGAMQITGGSVAVHNPLLFSAWLAKFGSERIMLGADANNRKVATHGWIQISDLDVVDFIVDYEQKGISYVVCTDVGKDGMLQGTSNELYQEILQKTNVKLIASGGVSSIEDLIRLREMGCDGAIVGKAIYEGKITLDKLREIC